LTSVSTACGKGNVLHPKQDLALKEEQMKLSTYIFLFDHPQGKHSFFNPPTDILLHIENKIARGAFQDRCKMQSSTLELWLEAFSTALL